jgi:hypothetical protein
MKAKKKAKGIVQTKQVYREIFDISINPTILLYSHLMVEFEKETNAKDVKSKLVSKGYIS